MIEGYNYRQDRYYKDQAYFAVYTAWHVAAFSRQKRLSSLKTILGKLFKNKKEPTKPKPPVEQLVKEAQEKGLKGPWDQEERR